MKTIKYLIFSLVVSLVSFTSVNAQENIIIVSETAQAEIKVSGVEINVTIIERNISAAKAKQTVDIKTKQWLNYLMNQGVDRQNIRSYSLSIRPVIKRGSYETPQQNDGFEVSRQFSVKLNDWDLLDKVLDAGIKLGITRVNSVQPVYGNQDKAYRTALENALVKTKDKANSLAKLANKTLGDALRIEEGRSHRPVTRAYAMAESAQPSLPGSHTVSATVTVTYLLK